MFQTSTEFFTKLGQWATINNIRLYILQEKDSVAKSSPELHYNKGIVSVNIYSFWSFNMITQFCKIGLECSSINSVKSVPRILVVYSKHHFHLMVPFWIPALRCLILLFYITLDRFLPPIKKPKLDYFIKKGKINFTVKWSSFLLNGISLLLKAPWVKWRKFVAKSQPLLLNPFFQKKWAIPGLFSFIFVFSIQLIVNKCAILNLPMTGFELQTSGIGSNCSTNCATTTAQNPFVSFRKQKVE